RPLLPPGRTIGERRNRLLALGENLHRNPSVDASMHSLAAVETIEVLRRQEIQHAAGARPGLGLEVRHTALARADREVEAEAVALKPPPEGRERTHPAPLAEDRTARVAAVAEVPERGITHGSRSRSSPPDHRRQSGEHVRQ